MDEAAVLRAALRHDALSAPIGFLLLGLGLATGALGLARRRSGDSALLYLSSLFTSLYALRLLGESETVRFLYAPPEPVWRKLIDVLTFVLPVPGFLFFERVIGSGWRSSIRRLWQLFAALALVAIPWEILTSERELAFGIYRWLVLAAITVTLANLFAPRREPDRDLWLLRSSFLVLGVFVILENLRALGLTPWRDNAEPLGFLIFNCGLG